MSRPESVTRSEQANSMEQGNQSQAHVFCRRVSEALALGYKLYGSPAITFNGKDIIVAQAIIWPSVYGVERTRRTAPRK